MGGAHGATYQIFGGGWMGLGVAVAIGLAVVHLGYMLAPKVNTVLFKA
jgi:hypothetical protein